MNRNLKQLLFSKCQQYADQRIANAQLAIDNAKESANDETKSSAGDKHETGRAMAQLEQEKSVKQLNEALDLLSALEKININIQSASVQLGSIAITNKGAFFISISAGKIQIESHTFFAISPASPLGSKIKNLKKSDQFELNGQSYEVLDVY